jgi:hypothetical protein
MEESIERIADAFERIANLLEAGTPIQLRVEVNNEQVGLGNAPFRIEVENQGIWSVGCAQQVGVVPFQIKQLD